MLEDAARQFKRWLDMGYDLKRLTINLSPIQFKEKDIVEEVARILDRVNLSPTYLEIEITESVLIEDIVETENKLKNFKEKGIMVALDDFGRGYSSLKYLKFFTLERIKIDREFIKDIPHNDNGSIAKIITNLGKNLDLKILAEGVETNCQYEFIKNLGVNEIQGYYFSKPIASEEIEKLLEKTR